jgi:hypothetical protein
MIFANVPLSFADEGHGKTRLNILYLSGSNTSYGNSSDAILAKDIDSEFVEDQDVKVYHKEIRNFTLEDLEKRDYSAIYISASVYWDIQWGLVDVNLLNKLKAFEYPTVVENKLAPMFNLANRVVDLNLTGSYYGTASDEVKVIKLPDHREFSVNVISNYNFEKTNVTSQNVQMYSDKTYRHGYNYAIQYQAVNELHSDAIISATSGSLPYGNSYPLIYGYEPGQSSLDNTYRVAGTFGTSSYSKYLSDDSVRLVANAVWWVLHEDEREPVTFDVEIYDEVRDEIISSTHESQSANATYHFSFEEMQNYNFLAWEKVSEEGTVTTLSDNVAYSEIPTENATYRARVERTNTVVVEIYDILNRKTIDAATSKVREGSSFQLSYETRQGFDFKRWTLFDLTSNTGSLLSTQLTLRVTPSGDAVYRAEVEGNFVLPESLSILEVQPTASYRLDETIISEALDRSVEITQMPMSVFIANRQQLNGLFDVIYVGEKQDEYIAAQDERLKVTSWMNVDAYDIKSFDNSKNIGEFYAPIDITHLRADEIKSFIETDQLVLMENSIFKNQNNSIVKDTFETVNASNFKAYNTVSNSTLIDLLSHYDGSDFMIKPVLEVMQHPLDFVSDEGESQYLTTSEDHYMSFNFKVGNYISNHTYEASLYLDFDGNNLFDASEGEKVVTKALYSENFKDVILRYNLPKSYVGFVPWKLEILDKTTGIKTYELGYTAFKGTSDDAAGMRHINVLQITPDNGGSYNLTYLPEELTHITGLYELSISKMTTSQFNANPSSLNGLYDMVVLGFADSLSTEMVFNDQAIQTLQSFIDSGQSILTTHDQFWYKLQDMNNDLMNVTKAFRDQFGQNIYAKDYLNNNKVAANKTMLPYVTIGNTTYNSVGYTNRTIDRRYNGLPTTKQATEINEGQITLFPYILKSDLNVSTTHFQYYQLDLEREDLMVWHNLTGGSYSGHDSRNDYYVYSIGNITYSGTGHASPRYYEDENELFVNTMIKASKTANHAPTMLVEDVMDGMVTYKSQNTLPISVTVSDIDLKDLTSKVSIYVDTNQDGEGDLLVLSLNDVDNETRLNLSIDKSSFNAYDLFDLIIIAEDTKGAKGTQVIKNIENRDTTALTISSSSSWDNVAPLIGDSASLRIGIEKTGSGTANFTDILVKVTVDKKQFDRVSTSTDILGWDVQTTETGKYIFTRVITDYEDDIEFSPSFNHEEGTLEAYVSLSYKNYGTHNEIMYGPKVIVVSQGQFIVSATDRFNRSVGGVDLDVDMPNDDKTVTTVANENVILDLDEGSGNYTVTYYLDGYKDAELIITYPDGTSETIERVLGENFVSVTLSLSGDNNPIDIALKVYQDIVTSVQINSGVGLVVSKEIEGDTTAFKNMSDTTKAIDVMFNLDKPTSKLTFTFEDSAFADEIVPGSGTYGFFNGAESFENQLLDDVLFDETDTSLAGIPISYDAVTKQITIDLGAGSALKEGIYSLKLKVHFDKGLKLFTDNQPHFISLIQMTSDVYDDADGNGIYTPDERFNDIVKETDASLVVGYLVFTDNTDLDDDRNGIVGFSTVQTNILEGAGYGDIELYIRPSKDMAFDDVNIRLALRYMEDGAVFDLANDESFYIVSIESVEGLPEDSVTLNPIDDSVDGKEIIIKTLPKADETNQVYKIKTRIFIENSKYDFKDYKLIFSLIYGVNVEEAKINQNVNVIRRLKLQ